MKEFFMCDRRNFIQKTLLGSVGMTLFSAFPEKLFSNENYAEEYVKENIIKLTILHTNDMHSRIEPFPDNDPKYAGLGGMARRAAWIEKIRAKEKNVLLFDAGDIFQGTPYFNLYGGELEFKLMSRMKYDACTIGNHDFDNGLNGLAKMLPFADFPFLCANYDFSDTVLNGKTFPYKIFFIDKIKVGVFGIGIELNGLVEKKSYEHTIYNNPIDTAEKISSLLKKDMNCDLVICLSHLGYKYDVKKVSDLILAENSSHIDIIIGGHTHTFLDEPTVVKNRMNRGVLVHQVGWAGIRLGKIDCFLKRGNMRKLFTKTNFCEIKKV